MKIPTKPYHPHKPSETHKKYHRMNVSLETMSLATFLDEVNKLGIKPENVHFECEIEGPYYDCGSASGKIIVSYSEDIPTPNYEKLYEKYKEDLRKYHIDLKQYNIDIEKYNKWDKENTIKQLENQLKILKNK